MITYALFNKDVLVHVTKESPYTGTPALKEFPGVVYDEIKSEHEYKSFVEVMAVAVAATTLTGKTYLPYDNGEFVSPRFGIFEPPKVGDQVSYGFNGDSYPCGTITRITPSYRITTSEGKVFNRRKNKPSWLMVGGTWSLIHGHHSEQNPHF